MEQLLINIEPEPSGPTIAASSNSLYVDLRGTIEILHESQCLTVGQFETAIFLLPDLASIANMIARFRESAPMAEARLLESPPLRVTRARNQPQFLEIKYSGQTIGPIRQETFETAMSAAVLEFFQWLLAHRPRLGIDAESWREIEVIASVWPQIEPLLATWRHLGAPHAAS